MKKILVAILLVFSFVALPFKISAQENADIRSLARQRIQEAKQNREELLQVVRQSNQEKREAVQEKLTEAKKHRVRLFAERLTTRLNAAIERLNTLIARIQARIDTLSQNGEDVSAMQADLDSAQSLVDEAKTTLDALDWDAMLEASAPMEVFRSIRTNVEGIKTDLMEAHRILVKIVGEIKGLRVGVEETQ